MRFKLIFHDHLFQEPHYRGALHDQVYTWLLHELDAYGTARMVTLITNAHDESVATQPDRTYEIREHPSSMLTLDISFESLTEYLTAYDRCVAILPLVQIQQTEGTDIAHSICISTLVEGWYE